MPRIPFNPPKQQTRAVIILWPIAQKKLHLVSAKKARPVKVELLARAA